MSNFEGPPLQEEQEKELIHISSEEWKEFANKPVDNPELIKWMEEKGISFDSGNIEIELRGKKVKMVTRREDFGTIVRESETSYGS